MSPHLDAQIASGTHVSMCMCKPELTSLPPEVLVKIFEYLDTISRCNSALTCKRLEDISKFAAFYKKMDFMYAQMNDEMMQKYLSYIPVSPNEVTIDLGKKITSKQYLYSKRFFMEYGKSLHKLNVQNLNKSYRPGEFEELVSYCVNLEEFSISDSYISVNIYRSITTLKTLKLRNCSESGFRKICDIMIGNPNLRKLHLYEIEWWAHMFLSISLYTYSFKSKLEEVQLQFESANHVRSCFFLRTLGRLQQLKKLVLIGSIKRNPQYVSREELDTSLQDAFSFIAKRCKKLESLTIHGWEIIQNHNLFPILESCTLTHLDLECPNVTSKIYDKIYEGSLKNSLKYISIKANDIS